jgi:hypothetical protein
MPALARTRDPETSHAAAATVDRRTRKALVFLAVQNWQPCTAARIQTLLSARASPESVRGALVDLFRHRKIEPVGIGFTPAGRRARLWGIRHDADR